MHADLLEAAHRLNDDNRELRKQKFFALSHLTAARARIVSLKDRLRDSAASGKVGRLLDDIQWCHQSGKFEDRQIVLDFVSDMVHDLRLRAADGSRSKNMRLSESTSRLLGMMYHRGGPKTTLLLTTNLGMIDNTTLRDKWNANLFKLNPGILEPNFE